MTRSIQGVSLLAVGALFMISTRVAGQAAATPAKATPTVAALPTATEADIEAVRADIRSKRKGVVAANITLTADEATKFWPLFDAYTAEVRKVNDKRWAMMKDYAANWKTMTDAQAKDHMDRSAAVDAELIALRTKYLPEFAKLVSAKKVAQFYQLDRRLDLWMNLQLSSLMPIVQVAN